MNAVRDARTNRTGSVALPARSSRSRAIAGSFAALLALVALLLVAPPGHAAKVAGVEIADTAMVGGEEMPLRGAGLRKKLFLKLYVAGLYGGADGAGGAEVAAADAAMMIRLAIRSDLVTRDKMVEALEDGLKKSTGGDTAPIRGEIDQVLAALPDTLGAGDVIDIVYTPETGTTLAREGEVLTTVEGLAFKEAVFGIWLSDTPVQANMKAAMLGG